MLRSKTVVVVTLVALSLVLTRVGVYQLGLHRGRLGVYRTQAILAFGHHKTYGVIAGLFWRGSAMTRHLPRRDC
jgi:hypothetical protein